MVKKQGDLVSRFGLIGRNIAYSFSRGYFKNKFQKEGIQATYENFDVQNITGLEPVLNNQSVQGYNVTIPYKEAIIPLLNDIDPAAAHIGAVNTIKREKDGSLTGYNTDYIGFCDSLLEYCSALLLNQKDGDPIGKTNLNHTQKALILGTGGASKGIQYALENLGVGYTIVSRKRKNIANTQVLLYEQVTKPWLNDHTFIINCTPLGTYPNLQQKPAIPYQFLHEKHVAYDLIYNPEETAFLKHAKLQGATTINGLRMLELQAEASWKIWNAQRHP